MNCVFCLLTSNFKSLDRKNEVGISSKNRILPRRVFRLVRFPLLFISLVLCLVSLARGYTLLNVLYTFSILLMLLLIYSYSFTRKVLFKFKYLLEKDRVEILAFKNNQIFEVFSGNRNELIVTRRQDFSFRYKVHTLNFYHNGKIIFRQKDIYEWNLNMFDQIEHILNQKQTR